MPIVSHRVFCLLGSWSEEQNWLSVSLYVSSHGSFLVHPPVEGLCVCWCRWGFGQSCWHIRDSFINGCYSAGDARKCTHDFFNEFVMWKFFVQGSDDFCHILWRSLQQDQSEIVPHVVAGFFTYLQPFSTCILVFSVIDGDINLLWMWRMKYWQCSQELSSEFGLSWSVADVVEPICLSAVAYARILLHHNLTIAEVLVAEVVGVVGGNTVVALVVVSCLFLFPLCGAVWAPASFCWALGLLCVSPLLSLMDLGLLSLSAEQIW